MNEHNNSPLLSRRALLRSALAGTATALLAACGQGPAVVAPTAVPLAQAPTAAPTALPPTATAAPTALPPTATPVPPSPTPVPPMRFALFGDFGMEGEAEQAVATLVKNWAPDYILALGDNNYPYGEAETIDANIGQYYHEYIAPYRGTYGPGAAENRFYAILGNHDWDSGTAQAYLDYFDMPGNGRYYTVDIGPIRLFALNSAVDEPDGVKADSAQAAWLQEALAQPTELWRVVAMHHSPYSSGFRGPWRWMRWPFKEWGADIAVAAHDHHYERLEVNGLTHLINGLGGGARYQLSDPAEGSLLRYNEQHGAIFLEATAATLAWRFVNVSGEEIDSFVTRR